jgi:hypothetical protein
MSPICHGQTFVYNNAKVFGLNDQNLFCGKTRDILIVVSIYPKVPTKKRVETFSCVSTNIGYFLFFLFVVEIEFGIFLCWFST